MNDNAVHIRELPNRSNHNCFGCSPINEYGLRMRFFTDGTTVTSNVIVPPHLCGWDNLVHGGVISTICDEIMSWTALHLLQRIILTRSMTVEFLRPTLIGQELRAEGIVIEKKSEREALIQGQIFNPEGELCARSQGTFSLFTLEAIRKMNILKSEILDDMEKSIKENPAISD